MKENEAQKPNQPAQPPKFGLIPKDNCKEIIIHGVILKEATGL